MSIIGLIVNIARDPALEHAKRAASLLIAGGHAVLADEAGIDGALVVEKTTLFERADILVTLGGDGTILHIADAAALGGKPVLGVNLGHLGYLTYLSASEMDRLPQIVSAPPRIEWRIMLSVEILFHDGTVKKHIALNDAVISRKMPGSMIRLSLFADDAFVYSYQSDGLIFATPTGSTAYSLSSGGPIADSKLQDIILVSPICEHSLFAKSMIFSTDNTLICRPESIGEGALLMIDGKTSYNVENIREISITHSEHKLPLIVPNGDRFYQILNQKFRTRGDL